eukprot:gnl/MRDRNA2_/MRDRNA2_107139_c0_seq1.p1 gnl/MRDRNA2_/MRDRNA2_107139_c0~~gnl/MRDRNA2_/MRDRNA2_107139_c0_seq1.p1  ORF type:complete len:555 (-),score=137.99 gnl/MRDRNA2_/MRDRNA2_107139_c0_seq1:5-1669(-)
MLSSYSKVLIFIFHVVPASGGAAQSICEISGSKTPDAAVILIQQLEGFKVGSAQAAKLENAAGKVYTGSGMHRQAACHFVRALNGIADEDRAAVQADLDLALLKSRAIEKLHSEANLRRDQGFPDQAIRLYEGVIAARHRAMNNKAPVADILSDLAEAYTLQGKYQVAMTTIEQALREPADGYIGKLANAAAHLQLGRVYHALGNIQKAREQYMAAIDAQSAELPSGHPDLAIAQLALAQLDSDIGEFSKALSKIEAATVLFAHSVSEPEKYSVNNKHYSTSQLPLVLGRAFRQRSDILQRYADHRKEALRVAEKAFKLQASVLGETAPEVAYTAKVLGNAQLLMGEASSALDNFQHALQANLATLGGRHIATASSYSYVARALQKLQQDATAEGYHQQSVKVIRAAQLSKDHLGNPSEEIVPFHNYAAFLWEHGRVQEAIIVLRYASQILKASDVPETSSRRKAVENTLMGMLSRVVKKEIPVVNEPKDVATVDSNIVPVDQFEVGEDDGLTDETTIEEIDRLIKFNHVRNVKTSIVRAAEVASAVEQGAMHI